MADTHNKYEERRKKVMLGNLPDDFLRLNLPRTNVSPGSMQPVGHYPPWGYNQVGSLSVSIIQAQLNKNYGLTKMDPYVRLRIGHNIYETHADSRSGKFPNWNKTFHSYFPLGLKTIHFEVFDEHALTSDERVAWTEFTLTEEVFKGKFVDLWIPLSGRLGEGKEGSINITVFFTPASLQPHPVTASPGFSPPVMMVPSVVSGVPYYVPGQPGTVQYPMAQRPMVTQANYPMQPPIPAPYHPSEEDVKQLQEVFPTFDREVIFGILESAGSKDAAINMLLTISENK